MSCFMLNCLIGMISDLSSLLQVMINDSYRFTGGTLPINNSCGGVYTCVYKLVSAWFSITILCFIETQYVGSQYIYFV